MRVFYILFILLLIRISSIAQYPAPVSHALKQTKNNQAQLKMALDHFYASGDGLKIKAVNFLIANMPIHSSQNYYWADASGKRIPFDELKYDSFNDAVEAFNKLKTEYQGIHPVPYQYRDIDSVTASYLVENIDLAVEQFRKNSNTKNISESDFLEYVLPYRISIEPLTNWRRKYLEKFAAVFGSQDPAPGLKQTVNSMFKNVWSLETSTEPLPRLSALQILSRKKGYCQDIADMVVFIARSNGIPSTVDNIPAWSTSTGNHFLNFLNTGKKNTRFDAVLDSIEREPGKVFRNTYSAQKGTLASWLDTTQIPDCFLRLTNYIDVTDEYWDTDSISCNLFPDPNAKVVYAAVLNGGVWQPLWYASRKGNKATFKNMGKGVAYLPMYYKNKQLVPAGYPYVLGKNNKAELKPSQQTHTIIIKEQERYLKYRPGKKYRLLLWNNGWQQIEDQTAPEGCTQLEFKKVPKNALLLLAPEYTQGKERPFMILENGERVWW